MPEEEDFLEVDFTIEDELMPDIQFTMKGKQKEILDLTLKNPFKSIEE